MSALPVIITVVIILTAIVIGLYLLLSKIADGDSRFQRHLDDLFITLIGVISISAFLMWRSFNGTADIDSPADLKTGAAVILLFLGLLFIASFILLVIRLKKEGKTLKEYLNEKLSFLKKKDAPKKEIKHKRKKKK